MIPRRLSKEIQGWQLAAALLDTTGVAHMRLKLAVVTGSKDLYRRIENCFAGDEIACQWIDPGKNLVVRALQRDSYSAVLYDIGHCFNSSDVLFEWRACHADRSLPLIVMARLMSRDIGQVFRAGADDVVLYPFDLSELHARTHLLLGRTGALGCERPRIEFGAYVLDKASRAGWLDGTPVRLTHNEFAMAWLLFSRAGECLSRRQIASAIWGCPEDIAARPLEQHVYRLRKKLQLDGKSGLLLRTVYARGYVLEAVGDRVAPAEVMPLVLPQASPSNVMRQYVPGREEGSEFACT